ncbi:DNA topoisomerase 3 [Paenibacillus sp. KN14-4R]|uniref:type IA DNA topoisomerase n=1 Tax=Paenibacillus sp. KN14-4R TaxID=3445773 RepID=UPI003FA0D3FC
MKTLIIAEKPDMGRNIAAAIEPRSLNKRTYIEGDNYIITWAIGHLIELAEPDAYDPKYKKWNIGHLPIIPETFRLIPNPRTKDQLNVIADLAKRCEAIVNACDAGREGQHIFALIMRYLQLRLPVKRLWISDLTPETIRQGFAELKEGSEYANLTKAARARSEADWVIGMNGTRAFTTKHNVLLSVGRVQTPVLALLYERQKLIESFDSLTFYDLEATFKQNETEYKGMWQGDRLTDPERADKLLQKVKGKDGIVQSYEVKETKEYPFKLYDLTLLQREANARYGFSAKKTLDLAQALYEKHKVISYPRTNSNYVTEANIPQMHSALNALRGTAYDQWAQGANKSLVHVNNKSICNPTKVEDHHAILPTGKRSTTLSTDENKLFDLVIRRFLSQYYPAAMYKAHTVMTVVEGEEFKTNIKQLLSKGWKAIYDELKQEKRTSKKKEEDEEEEAAEVTDDFSVVEGQASTCTDALVKEKMTQPPKAFTEGTLLKAMESAGKSVEDEELREAMKDSGLGTPATRAATIERLKNVGYIEAQGKRMMITLKGRTAIELIRNAGVELLTSPEMTGQWERRLNAIAKGEASDEAFMQQVKKFAGFIVEKVRQQSRAAQTDFGEVQDGADSGKSGKGKGTAASKPAKGKSASRGKAAEEASGERKSRASASSAIAACPREGCGGTIFMGKKGYGCSHYKTGCGFVIWKESFGRTLTDTQVKALIEKGKTAKLKLKTDSGDEIDGRILLMNPSAGTLSIERV